MTPTVEYVDFLMDGLLGSYLELLISTTGLFDEPKFLQLIGKDELYPLNLSRYFWILSNESQRVFEARVLRYGRN